MTSKKTVRIDMENDRRYGIIQPDVNIKQSK